MQRPYWLPRPENRLAERQDLDLEILLLRNSASPFVHEGVGVHYPFCASIGNCEEGCKSLDYVRDLALNQEKQSIMVMIKDYGKLLTYSFDDLKRTRCGQLRRSCNKTSPSEEH